MTRPAHGWGLASIHESGQILDAWFPVPALGVATERQPPKPLVAATQVDTILHTHLIVDSTRASSRALHEINVIGTMSLLAAAGASGSPVRKVVLKSSGLVYGANKADPYNFREDMSRSGPATTPVERSLLEVEAFVRAALGGAPSRQRPCARDVEHRAAQFWLEPVSCAVAGA